VKTGDGYADTPDVIVSFTGTNGERPQAGLVADSAGNLYGTTYTGGANNYGTVFEIAKTADGYRQQKIEKSVSAYIRDHFGFVVVQIDEKVERMRLESRMISTVSLCNECKPSPQWLGLASPKEKIRESGLWLVNELYKEPLSLEDIAILVGGT
jgi:uncharacterized repeat protein (TIGR03803 family)